MYNEWWLLDKNFSMWLRRANYDYSAYCVVCRISCSLSNKGRRAISSHMAGGKKKKKRKTEAMSNSSKSVILRAFLRPVQLLKSHNPSSQAESETKVSSDMPVTNTPAEMFVLKEKVMKSEIIWCTRTIMQHQSICGGAASVPLFQSGNVSRFRNSFKNTASEGKVG
ncbi:hypothetical protein PR048_017332 [Dryococelus australis]|uniref:Uncharacterized protein n=1 Tax=Dryococelus australis TaxID=614101 RepID=A0ABQ9H977_9NEOP|nr:hypothetical protein PR048_017332 [Dryococelus australis]